MWEYHMEILRGESIEGLPDLLFILGNEGWELATLNIVDGSLIIFFKRQRSGEADA